MKPFDLELAKAGHPIQTRDGRSVRIICYDVKGHDFPIMALIMEEDNKEMPYLFSSTGHINNSIIESRSDLVMASTKKEGWINVYQSEMYLDTTIGFSSDIYKTEELAIKGRTENATATIKIEWEE